MRHGRDQAERSGDKKKDFLFKFLQVPTYHCMHTPGGPLKYSLEGHQFAIFAMKLSSDNRYIISCSNKFITFDVVTSDLARQVAQTILKV